MHAAASLPAYRTRTSVQSLISTQTYDWSFFWTRKFLGGASQAVSLGFSEWMLRSMS